MGVQLQDSIDEADSVTVCGLDLEAAAFPILTPDHSEVQSGHSERIEARATPELPAPLLLGSPPDLHQPGQCLQGQLTHCKRIRFFPRHLVTLCICKRLYEKGQQQDDPLQSKSRAIHNDVTLCSFFMYISIQVLLSWPMLSTALKWRDCHFCKKGSIT